MGQPSERYVNSSDFHFSSLQQLQQIFGYFGQKTNKNKQIDEPQHQKIEENLYQGCQYEAEEYHNEFEDFKEFQQSQNRLSGNLTQGFDDLERTKINHDQCHSQPISINRQNFHHQKANVYRNNQHISSSQVQLIQAREQNLNSRTVTALVSAKKGKQNKKNKANSSNSSVSSKEVSTKNKILQLQKEKKKNGDNQIEALFINPLTSQMEMIDKQAFQKFYKLDYMELFQKINEVQKKLSIMGEKVFFKDKDTQSQLNEIFRLTGLKTSNKLGKSKSLRELRALFKYLNESTIQSTPIKLNDFGEGARKLESAYLAQFRQLMGYNAASQQQNSIANQGLFGFGFQKLQRKK